jgi:hypothetical protein
MVMRSLVRAVYRFLCGNCRRSRKFFAVRYGYNKGDNELVAVKLGEHPPLSLQIPSRLRKLFGTDQEKFNKALRSEALRLGRAAVGACEVRQAHGGDLRAVGEPENGMILVSNQRSGKCAFAQAFVVGLHTFGY